MKGISIVIPAYNEQGVIADVLRRIREATSQEAIPFEIIVVDDGSTDGTAAAAQMGADRVISSPFNRGYGASLKLGIRAAAYDWVLTMDADGQHSPEDISSFLRRVDGNDMVIGERDPKAQSRNRRFGKYFLEILAMYLIGCEIPDLNSGFRLIKKSETIERLHMLPNGFSFSTTITMVFLSDGLSVAFVPVATVARQVGQGKLRPLSAGVRTLLLMLRLILLFNPIKVFLPISGLFVLTGLAFVGINFFFLKSFRVPASSVISFSVGGIVFCFALLAEQISSLNRKAGR